MKIPQSIRDLLPKAPLAHLTTLNSDGSTQVTVLCEYLLFTEKRA
jgi:hypothetical protein